MNKELPTPEEIAAAMDSAATVYGYIATHAATIAHARRTIYLAYLHEGFTEAEALELCKVLSLT